MKQNQIDSFWPLLANLRNGKWVDLTHTCDEKSPHHPLFAQMWRENLMTIDEHGVAVQKFHLVGQLGTHVDPPSHFIEGGRNIDEISVREMMLPLCVIDVSKSVKDNVDYALTLEDVLDWERKNGPIPEGAFVAMYSDWGKRWPNQDKIRNVDVNGGQRTPGWSLAALRYLCKVRHITACGHETIDTDPGLTGESTSWECERYLLSQDKFQVELLTGLDQCPSSGALIVCAFPKVGGAVGFPARCWAICTQNHHNL